MFGDWVIVLSIDNKLLQLYENQEIAKEPEAGDQVVTFIMVDTSDGTIDCINYVFKSGATAKSERVIQTRKNPHDKVRKEP